MSDIEEPQVPVGKTTYNEQVKLVATTLNTIGLACFGVGVLTPILSSGLTQGTIFRIALGTLILGLLHFAALATLRRMKD